ncbi:MAG: T9SS type A sorting domain-containing protein [Fluviicola sp.]|nr:T9SS type A sorting domain-containing protein [Fluviicola sp.]
MNKTLLTLIGCLVFSYLQGQFTKSFSAGTNDPIGNFMGGTEMRVLANHKGMLFGGVETWMDDTTGTCDPFIGAQIMRLESPNGQWKLDKHFNTFFPQNTGRERKRNEGITALESVIFKNDKNGVTLTNPDTLLIAAARDFTGVLSVYTRNDNNGVWTETEVGTIPNDTIGSTDNDGTIRSFILYRDPVTGIDRIFAGSLPNGIIAGAYDASLPGKIEWDTVPELTGFVGRPMAFAVCNGDLYCAIAPSIYKRDNTTATWTAIFTYPFNVFPGGSSGLRGLTTINNPNGAGQSLIAALEGTTSKIYRITPGQNSPTEEIDIDTLMTTAFGFEGQYYVIANSEMTWITEPITGDSVLTITIQHHPANIRDDAFYLIRKQVGNTITYSLKRIDNDVYSPLTILNSTRAIVPSPFANDSNFVFLGGYDADNNISHNTAYVLRASKSAFFNPIGSTPTIAGLKHKVIFPSLTDVAIDNVFGYHQTYLNTAIAPLNKLFLFLPGSNSSPFAYDEVQKLAAEIGYHSLGISYSNATISPLCSGSNDSLCFDKVRGEVITGAALSDSVDVNVANSINNRVLKALQYLNTNFPSENWGQFYSGSTILWNKIALAGHSQGGGHAAFIAKQNTVDRVVLLASPKDYFTAPLSKAAAWINSPSTTPPCRYYALTHEDDFLGCTYNQQLQIFNRLGIDTFATNAIFETSNGNYNNSHVIISTINGLNSNNAHNIVGVDVLAANICNVPYYTPAWSYMMTNDDCLTIGIDNQDFGTQIVVYPNPAVSELSVTIPFSTIFRIELFNSMGVRVLETENQSKIDVSQLSKGVYFIKVTGNKTVYSQKIIIQ